MLNCPTCQTQIPPATKGDFFGHCSWECLKVSKDKPKLKGPVPISMNALDFLKLLTVYAQQYRAGAIASVKRNSHMNKITESMVVEQSVVDALLVDFINDIGVRNGIDYAMYTCDLIKPEAKVKELEAV